MLVLGRKLDERITIGEDIEIVICSITKSRVVIGVKAPLGVRVARTELLAPDKPQTADNSADSA